MTVPIPRPTIRPATLADAAALRELRLAALADSPQSFAADYDLTAAQTPADWASRLAGYDNEQNGCIFVADAQGALAGMTGIVRGHWPKTRHAGDIWGVYVRPEWRGGGLGGNLVNACLGWARAAGLAQVKLAVITRNTPAIACYTRCGFTVYGVEPRVLLVDGVYYDELLMVRLLKGDQG